MRHYVVTIQIFIVSLMRGSPNPIPIKDNTALEPSTGPLHVSVGLGNDPGQQGKRRNEQATANQKKSKTAHNHRYSLDSDYGSDVLSFRNDLRVIVKKKKKNGLKSRRLRDANGSDAFGYYYPYDYDQFRREYFDFNWDRKNDSRMEPGEPKKNLTYYCTPNDWLDGVGPITLYCTLRKGFEEGFQNPIMSRLIQLFKFWLTVYLVAGGALWVICGWCCCCLKCKMFKPEEIRQEVRSYILQNPPGVFRDKMLGEKITYTPTREEIDAYNDLEIKAYAYV